VQANTAVKVADEDPSPDLAPEPPVVDVGPRGVLTLDRSAWEPVLVDLSRRLDAHPEVHASSASLDAVVQTRTFVDSAGTRLRTPRQWIRVALTASTTAEDGAELRLYRWRDVRDPSALPDAATLEAWADDLRRDLVELRSAPAGEAYSGPVLLRGKAAGVFVHEVLGHRVEGHRQKDDEEGHTFKDKVGQSILPPFLDVWDDPTVETLAGEQLNGAYAYDDEGVPARRASIVEDGVFRGFLMSRSPIAGFPTSNGHGRAGEWSQPVARMANLVVETSAPVPAAQLRARLLAEVRAQGRPFGLLVDEIDGGFTLTGRMFPNAFNVRAVTAWRVYADGCPDERVRTIDLVGTPLVALANVVAAGDDPGVFNGFCGAESGYVPVSAVSPSLLLRTLEVQKKEKGADRPPLLPKPSAGGDT
jgi:predicted Zn-dependent protease